MPELGHIRDVVKGGLCIGCGACSQVISSSALDLETVGEGFLQPGFNEDLAAGESELALKVCPGFEVHAIASDSGSTELWGNVRSVYLGWSTDSAVRHRASSGGGITALLIYLLEAGQVDCVLQIGVSDRDPFDSCYKICTTAEEVINNSGSRYCPSAPLIGLREATQHYGRVAFVGKPCDVTALRKIAQIDKDIAGRVTFYISFMCAGTPSAKGTDAILKKFGLKRDDVANFRYRGDGWPGYATATAKDGSSHKMTYKDSWGGILNKHLHLRCKICIDGTGEDADLTFGDGWFGSEDGYPSFEESTGRSLILVRNSRGGDLLRSAQLAGAIELEDASIDIIREMQPYQAIRKRLVLSRIVAMKLFFRPVPSYSWGLMLRLALSAGLKNNLVSFAGMVRRLMATVPRKQ